MTTDDGERVKLGFGTLPTLVSAGTTTETTISIMDDDLPSGRLITLVVSPKDIDGFVPDITDYMVGVGAEVTQATIAATGYRSDDTITINGTEVTNDRAHAVDLSVGAQHLRGRGEFLRQRRRDHLHGVHRTGHHRSRRVEGRR